MSGPIVDLPLRVCAACRIVYMEDDRMYEDPSRCPRCGGEPVGEPRGGGKSMTVFSGIFYLGAGSGAILGAGSGAVIVISPYVRWP